jgi:hypothetical protein
MKSMKIWFAVACACSMLGGSAIAADQKAAKLTCCEEAAARGKECRHKCCVAAHKEDKSCAVCNSQQQDLKLKKNSKKTETSKASNATSAQ